MWNVIMIEILRNLIDDASDSPKYTDDRLERLLLVAAFQVSNELDFTNDYTVNIAESSLTPDPTAEATKEDAFVNLTCIKAACILERGSAITSADNAISAREFSSSINLTGIAAARRALLDKGGWCVVYDEESTNHALSSANTAGAAVLSPFRTIVGYDGMSGYSY